jgi:hypothetical protein
MHLSVYVRTGRRYVCVHQCAVRMDRLCAHALAGSCSGLGLKPEPLNRASPCPSASTACGFGTQAFGGASAFNANIGAWNTARVFTLSYVCAAPGRGVHYGGRARPGFGVARPVVRGGTADARACAHTCMRSLARGLGCRYGRPEGRFDTCIRIYAYIYICVCARVPRLHIHDPFICIGENRPALCMRAPVCDGDGSAVCARVGGLVPRARPQTRTPKPCEPLPVGVDRVRLRRAGVWLGEGFQRGHRRVEHRCGHHVGPGRRRSRPRRAPWRTRSAGLRCGAAGCAQRHRRCAHACAHVQALALRGAMGVGTAGRRGDSIHASEYLYICI